MWPKTHSVDHEHILSGIVKCPICGAGLNGFVNRWKNKKTGEYHDVFYYRCQRRRKIDEEHFCTFTRHFRQEELNGEVEWLIRQLALNEQCRKFILQKLDEELDTGRLEKEREQLMARLRQTEKAKDKLGERLERLDISDPHYDRKYQDMLDRQNDLYDRISELQDDLSDVSRRLREMEASSLSAAKIYKILSRFDKLYDTMTDREKKEFMAGFIKRIDIFPEEQEDGTNLKQISFRFPVYYDGQEGDEISLLSVNTVETCVLLSNHF